MADCLTTAEKPMQPRQFKSISRTVLPFDGGLTLDAVDEDGRAWWLIVGNDEAPHTWTEFPPLPSREDWP